jgi:hypothetical protein
MIRKMRGDLIYINARRRGCLSMRKSEASMPVPSARSLIEAVGSLMRRRSDNSFPSDTASSPAPRTLPWGEDIGAFAADIDAALELRALARRGPEEANLLPRRLVELGLDPDEIARLEPALFRELHWHCTMCDSQGECSVDLAGDAVTWPERTDAWHGYCRNAATLRLISEIPWFAGTKK